MLSIPKTSSISEPGETYNYSNIGFGILGLTLSRAAKKPFMELVKDKIFTPLNMNSSYFVVPNTKVADLAIGMGGGPPGKLDKITPVKEHMGRGYKVPNGGIYSTPNDLAKFMIHNMGYTETLNKENLELMQIRQTPKIKSSYSKNKSSNYGLGFFLHQDSKITTVGHGGWVSGYRAMFLFEKQSQYGVILMRNYNWGIIDLHLRSENLLRKLQEVTTK